MEQLLKQEIAGILDQIQRSEAPPCTEDEGTPLYNDTNAHRFSVVDAKDDSDFIKEYNEGTIHYINGKDDTSPHIVCVSSAMMNTFTASPSMTGMGMRIKAD